MNVSTGAAGGGAGKLVCGLIISSASFISSDYSVLRPLELQGIVREDFTIMEKAPTRAFSVDRMHLLGLSHIRHY